jgi:hypothetical protein
MAMLSLWLAAGTIASLSSNATSQPLPPPDAAGSELQFLEARVPEELVIDGIVLAQHDLQIMIRQDARSLVISLIAIPSGRVVATTTIDAPPVDREASLAVVTQVTATLYSQYAVRPGVSVEPRVAPDIARSGFTLDLGFGVSRPGGVASSSGELALGIGIGAWIFPGKLALTARWAMTTVDESQVSSVSASYIANDFLGASLQYWLDDHLWVAGGPGFVAFSAAQTYDSLFPTRSACDPDCVGVGLDLRVGYAVGAGRHQLEISGEAITGLYSNDPNIALRIPYDYNNHPVGQAGTATTLMAMIGYHFL